MSYLKWTKAAAAIAVMSVAYSVQASATESGFYVGATLGSSKYDVDSDVEEYFNSSPSGGLDDSDTTWSLVGGYRFLPYVGIELGYVDLGEISAYENYQFLSTSGRVDLSLESKGPTLALTSALPIGNFEFDAKLGVLFAKTTDHYRDRFGSFVDEETFDANTEELLFGIGVGYTIADHFFINAMWTRYKDVGDEEETGEGDINTLTAGFSYRF